MTTNVIDVRSVANGVLTTNSAAANASALQALIDANTNNGASYGLPSLFRWTRLRGKAIYFLLAVIYFRGLARCLWGASPSYSALPSDAAFLVNKYQHRPCYYSGRDM